MIENKKHSRKSASISNIVIENVSTSPKESVMRKNSRRTVENSNENIKEVQESSILFAGWRPLIGWFGSIGMGYQFVVYPILSWIWPLLFPEYSAPPMLSDEMLFSMVGSSITIAGMRSFEKFKSIDTKKIRR